MIPTCPRCHMQLYMQPRTVWSSFSTSWVCRRKRLTWVKGWLFWRQAYRECGVSVIVTLPYEEWL